jgi:hypothetical protein
LIDLQIFCAAQAAVVFYTVHLGFGKTGSLIDSSFIEPIEKVGGIILGHVDF